MKTDIRNRWKTHIHLYTWRAYMSSGLTNLKDDQAPLMKATLEKLYMEVFEPLNVFLYLPHLWSDPGHNHTMDAESVHALDRLRIAESDFLVLCADYPSFGAGQEFEIAQAMGLQTIVFHRRMIDNQKVIVSRMLRGGPGIRVPVGSASESPSESVIVYNDEEELCSRLRDRVNELINNISHEPRATSDVAFPDRLRSLLKKRHLSVEELATRAHLSVAFVEFLVSSDEHLKSILKRWRLPDFEAPLSLDKYVNPGFWIVHRISDALNCTADELIGEKTISMQEAQERAMWRRFNIAATKEGLPRDSYEQIWSREDVRIAARSGESELRKLLKRLNEGRSKDKQDRLPFDE